MDRIVGSDWMLGMVLGDICGKGLSRPLCIGQESRRRRDGEITRKKGERYRYTVGGQ